MFEPREPEVLVVGGGPVGLLAALFLVEKGVRVQVVDQEQRGSQHSYALAMHPATLDILEEVGLASALIPHGRPLTRMAFYEGAARHAEIDFTQLPGRHARGLVLRQSVLERAVEEELGRRKLKVLWNHRLESLTDGPAHVDCQVARLDQVAQGYPIQRSEWVVGKVLPWRPRFVLGADGYDSPVRRKSGIAMRQLPGGVLASVFEFEAEGELPEEARVMLDPGLTSVYWPLEPGRCRVGFEIREPSEHRPTPEALATLLAARAPWFSARPGTIFWSTLAQFERKVAERFGQGNVWLAGDAAHLATPVGVHSMNVGIREARDLAHGMAAILKSGIPAAVLDAYDDAARAEWRVLLGEEGVRALPAAQRWVAANAGRILASIPASGEDLVALLRQIAIAVGPA